MNVCGIARFSFLWQWMPWIVVEVRMCDISDGWTAADCSWPPTHAGSTSRQHLQGCTDPVSARKGITINVKKTDIQKVTQNCPAWLGKPGKLINCHFLIYKSWIPHFLCGFYNILATSPCFKGHLTFYNVLANNN